MAISPTGDRVAIATASDVSIWGASGDLKWSRPITRKLDWSPGLGFSSDGHTLVLTTNSAFFLDADEGKIGRSFELGEWYDTVRFSPDGSRVLSHIPRGWWVVWDPTTGSEVSYQRAMSTASKDSDPPEGWFVRNGRQVVVPTSGGVVLSDAESGIALELLPRLQLAQLPADAQSIALFGVEDGFLSWDLNGLPDGQPLSLACQRAAGFGGTTDLPKIFGIDPLQPICEPGFGPLPYDRFNIRK